jgi:uncharacterized delta-60 repeat protein
LDGALDPTFGTGGLVTTGFFSSNTRVAGVVLQPGDNKLVVAGTVQVGNPSKSIWALARYLPNGQLDTDAVTGFGALNATTMKRPGEFTFDPSPGLLGGSSLLSGLVLEPNGKIVVAGEISRLTGTLGSLARFNSDGSLDTTFGSGGFATDSLLKFNEFTAITLVNNQIIVAGFAFNPLQSQVDFVARFSADGFSDTSFGGAGSGNDVLNFGSASTPTVAGLAADNMGRIVVAGSLFLGNNSFQLTMVRLNADGSMDNTFGNAGLVTSTPLTNFNLHAVTVQPDQRIVVAGEAATGMANGTATGVIAFGVARFTSSGALDTTFGQGGGQLVSFSQDEDAANSLALQPDGSIVLAGSARFPKTATTQDHTDFALARLTPNGMPDPNFGTNGQVTTNVGQVTGGFLSQEDQVESVLLQPDGKIVAAGESSSVFALARYLGTPPTTGTGEIKGSKWIDADGDGVRQPGEPGIPGATIFVDLHRDGRLDPGDPFAVTDANGNFDIQNVPPGTYPVIDESADTQLELPSGALANSVDFGFSVGGSFGEIAVGDPLANRIDPTTNNPAPLGRVYTFDGLAGGFEREVIEPPPTNTNPLFPNHDGFGFAVEDFGGVTVASPFRWEPYFIGGGPIAAIPSEGAVFEYTDPFNPTLFSEVTPSDFHNPMLDQAVLAQIESFGLSIDGDLVGGGISAPGPQHGLLAFNDHSNESDFGAGDAYDSISSGSGLIIGGSPDVGVAQLFRPPASGVNAQVLQVLTDPTSQINTSFGTSVAITSKSGESFIGAPAENTAGFQAGALYRFDNLSTSPTLGRTFLDPAKNANDHFGFSMALVGSNEILIGAPGDSTFGPDSGAVYLFNSQTGELLQTLYGPNPHAGAQFGFSLADINNQSFVAGAPSTGDNTDPGAAYLMQIAPMVTIANGQVVTVGFPKIPGPQGATIQAKEGAHTGPQTVATFGAATFAGKTLGSATINWGDGMTDNVTPAQDPTTRLFQVQGSHTYAEEGNYPITVTILASDGSVLATVSSQANVADPGILVAQLLSPQAVEGTDSGLVSLLTFTDPGGPEALTDYSAEIDWGDNTLPSNATIRDDPAGTGDFFVLGDHQYQEEGSYPISVTLHHEGVTSFVSGVTADVSDAAVAPLKSFSVQAQEGTDTGLVPLLTFTDPGGPEPLTDYSASLDWGDQTTTSGTIQFDPSTNIFSVLADHIYQEQGNYVIDVTVNHDGTLVDVGGIQATVVDPAVLPLRTPPLPTLVEGTPAGGFTLLTFQDPAGPEPLTDYSATIDWGDQTTSSGAIFFDSPTQLFSVVANHLYLEEGSYVVRVTVNHDGVMTTQSLQATVLDAPLHSAPVSVSAIAGGPFSGIVGSFTDSDPNGTLKDYSALIIWGDTSFAYSGIITANGSGGYNVVGSHTYAAAGNFRLVVEIFDTFGGAQSNAVDTAVVTNLGQFVQPGLTGGIGFWHTSRGQKLINNFNGGSAATALSSWLVATFPNLYGITTGANDLTGFTNAQVAAYYQNLFSTPGPKLEAEVLAVALDVFATTQSLGGNAGTAYGFNVTTYGLGAFSFNVGSSGAAFGVADNTVLNVFQILKGVNQQAVHGILYNGNRFLDLLALAVFDGIASAGSI